MYSSALIRTISSVSISEEVEPRRRRQRVLSEISEDGSDMMISNEPSSDEEAERQSRSRLRKQVLRGRETIDQRQDRLQRDSERHQIARVNEASPVRSQRLRANSSRRREARAIESIDERSRRINERRNRSSSK